MAFKFRFPLAILHYLDEDKSRFGMANAIEKAREWALPLDQEKRVRPTLKDAEEYINEIVKAREQEKDDRIAKRDY